MRTKLIVAVLIGMMNAAEARDPFLAPLTVFCAKSHPLTWRLLGVTGHKNHFVSWFLSPAGTLSGVSSGEVLSESGWQVVVADEKGVVLKRLPPCETQQITLPLFSK
ncbi:hypothetical protein ACGVWS_05550 [Enterobacteriaceae bacterium LUAb1]